MPKVGRKQPNFDSITWLTSAPGVAAVVENGGHSPSQFQADFFLERSAAHNQPRLRKETTLRQACPLEYRGAQCAFKDSMLHGSCNSHYVSQFAAFFIDARTKRSVVESFESLVLNFVKNCILHSVVCVCVQPRPD